jgi:DNA-binding MarR family transcriptional regulator
VQDVVGSKKAALDTGALSEAARVCACFNFRKASRAVTQLFDAILQPGGLRSTQFVILVAVHVGKSVRLPDLARQLNVDRSTLTRNLQPLVREGLVKIAGSSGERASAVRLTPKGERMLAETIPLWEDAQTRFIAQLGGKRWKAMLSDLDKVVKAAHGA